MANEPRMSRNELEASLYTKAWKDESFKRELINNPKTVIARELELSLRDDVEIRVLEETANNMYFVIPAKPQAQELSEEQLEAVAGGWDAHLCVTPISGGINTDA